VLFENVGAYIFTWLVGYGTLPEELRLMVEDGATPMRALSFGTAAAADLLDLGDEIGALQPGKRADLLAVAGDPLRDILALRDVRLVLCNGNSVVRDERFFKK
jgi:imidazolonepropionase-like amidohydrolase